MMTSSLAFGSLARFKIITDNADATDLFFHGFLLCCWISLRLWGAMIVTDYLLLEESCAVQAQIQSERNPISSGNVRLNEIREKIKSVASVLFVNSLSACGLSRRRRSMLSGTVFQTALFSLVIIPRLRPGLLSLRSVLSSRQLLLCSLAFGSLAMFKIYHG